MRLNKTKISKSCLFEYSNSSDRVNFNRTATNYSFQIPAGKYFFNNLLSIIQIGMNAFDANTYVLSYDVSTLKVTISGLNIFILNWATNSNAFTGCWKELGFTFANTASVTSQTGSNVIQLYQPINIIIYISEFSVGGITDRGAFYSFICTFTVNGGEIQHFIENQWFTQQVHLVDSKLHLNSLSVQLLYNDGSPLFLNGSDWSMTLEIFKKFSFYLKRWMII